MRLAKEALLVFAALCWGATPLSARADIKYTITDLGSLGGNTYATGINNSGTVSGYSYTAANGPWHAFSWTPISPNSALGTMHDLGTVGGTISEADGINSQDEMTGHVITASGEFHVMSYDGTMHDTGVVGRGYGVNDSGQIIGQLNTGGISHALILDSGVHDLGTLGGAHSRGTSINAGGQATGYSDTDVGAMHAFFYDGAMHDLGTFGGTHSFGLDINNKGQIVGYADEPGSDFKTYHAFFYDGTLHDLGTLGGSTSTAGSINEQGDITGSSATSSGSVLHAFLYTASNGMVDLNSLVDPTSGWILGNGYAINEAGQIVGSGTLDGKNRGFLITPVPEPADFVLAGIGTFGLIIGWVRERLISASISRT